MSTIPKILSADFRAHAFVDSNVACMICFENDSSDLFSHVIITAEKVHHVACINCLKSWAENCANRGAEPFCPLCRQVFSERALVKICSVFSEGRIKQRGDLWQRQYIELFHWIATTTEDSLDIQQWYNQANKIEEELKYFLISLRYNFIKLMGNPEAAQHFLKSVGNLYRSIEIMKFLGIGSSKAKFADPLSPDCSLSGTVSGNYPDLENYIDEILKKVLKTQEDMISDYKAFADAQYNSKKISFFVAALTFGAVSIAFSSVQNTPEDSETQALCSFSNLAKTGFSIVISGLAYMRLRSKIDVAVQIDLLDRVKRLALD